MAWFAVAGLSATIATEQQVVAPEGGLKVIVSGEVSLNYPIEEDGKPVLTNSPLGLEFKDGTKLGPRKSQLKAEAHNLTPSVISIGVR